MGNNFFMGWNPDWHENQSQQRFKVKTIYDGQIIYQNFNIFNLKGFFSCDSAGLTTP